MHWGCTKPSPLVVSRGWQARTARVPEPLSPVTTTNCGSSLDRVVGVSCSVRRGRSSSSSVISNRPILLGWTGPTGSPRIPEASTQLTPCACSTRSAHTMPGLPTSRRSACNAQCMKSVSWKGLRRWALSLADETRQLDRTHVAAVALRAVRLGRSSRVGRDGLPHLR